MINSFFIRHGYLAGLIAIIFALVVYKLSFLGLPYYWDEAWPYSVAVHTMYDHGLSFLPTAVPAFVSRGHPLMFHFLAALWMNVFGTGLVAGHAFALFVSVLTIISVYFFCKAFFSERVGFIACLFLGSQAIFIAQSAFLMPEMIMALWTMVGFHAWFAGRRLIFVAVTAAMLLTKESGGVFIITLGFAAFLKFLRSNEKNILQLAKTLAYIACPVLIAATYFVAQKILYGWFLFPFYTTYIADHSIAFKDNLETASAYMFVYYGRNGLSLFIILSLIVIYARHKWNFSKNEQKILPVLGLFVLFYLLFSAINYYIPRYLLCAFPPFIVAGAVLIDKALAKIRIVFPLVVTGIAVTCIYFYAHQLKDGDNDYTPSIKVAQSMVTYCEQEKLQDKHIFMPSVLRIDFNEPYAGYLSGKAFSHIQWEFDSKTAYCVFSKDEDDSITYEKIKRENRLELQKKFEIGYAWCELYRVIR